LDACSTEPDGGKRLACYDREIERLHKLAPTPVAAPTTPAPEESFGMTEALQRKSSGSPSLPQLENLKARITGVVHKTPYLRITLENGQVWEQSEPESHLAFVALAPGDTVTLHRGVLGAFYLSSDKVRGLRVRRLQ
jgi:hypothetical protein